MAKSGYLARLQRQHQEGLEMQRNFDIQFCLDAALIACNELWGIGEKRAEEFVAVYQKVCKEVAELIHEDARSDKQIDYAKAKIDERLKQICGRNFVPWAERYGV